MTSLRATRISRAGLPVSLLMTAACASVPDLGARAVPQSPSNYESSRSLAGARSDWPTDGWWQLYGDAQLNRLIAEGLAGSPDLAVATARLRSAQGLAQEAGAAVLPSIDGSASIDEQKRSLNADGPGVPVPGGWHASGSVGLGLNLDLDLFGKNRAALRVAKHDAEAAGFDADEARLVLTTGIASAYADLAALYAQRDNLGNALAIRNEMLTYVKARYDAGLETIDSVRQAQARIPQTQADISATDEAIVLDKHAIAALAGEGPDRALSISRPSLSGQAEQGIPADASIDLIGRRPDIAAARARLEAAAESVKQARAAFYPDINIAALVGLQSLGLSNLFTSGSEFAGASPAISLPLFHGGSLQGQYRSRRGDYDAAVAQYDGLVAQALRQTADAVTSKAMLANRLGEERKALAALEDAFRAAQGRYREGLSSYVTVLTAEESLVAARLSVAQLETRALTLDVELVRALGGGFATPNSTEHS